MRQDRSAAIDARPTCVPTCSLLMGAVATSVVSATVSMKVEYSADKVLSSQKKSVTFTSKSSYCEYTVHRSLFNQISLCYRSASLLLPTSGPHGPEGGLLREA